MNERLTDCLWYHPRIAIHNVKKDRYFYKRFLKTYLDLETPITLYKLSSTLMLLQCYQHFNNPKLEAALRHKSVRLASIFSTESSEGGK